MPARVLEISFLIVVVAFIALFILVSGMSNTSLLEEQVLIQELKAKQLLLALDNLPPSQAEPPPETSVIDLLRIYYNSDRDEYLEMARENIENYTKQMLSGNNVWRVQTSDGKLDIKSSFFDSRARVCGSANTDILNKTTLIVTVCAS